MPKLATWFTPSLQTISRSSGRSAVAAAAYRACTELHDERTGITHNFKPKAKRDLVCNVLVGVPNNDISKLWNDAERAENRNNSTVARELMLPLPHEWTDKQRRDCVYDIATMLNDKYKVAVQASIHRKSKTNVNEHGHIEFTTREVDKNGKFGKKTRILDDKKTNEVSKLRETICEIVNSHAVKNQSDWYVYAGKFSDIIEDHIPTNHISINHGRKQEIYIALNRQEVADAKKELKIIKNNIASIDMQIEELSQVPTYQQIVNKQETAAELVGMDKAFKEELKAQLKQDFANYEVLGDVVVDLAEQLRDCNSLIANGIEPLGIFEIQIEYTEKRAKLDKITEKFKDQQFKEMLKELNLYYIFNVDDELQSVDYTQSTNAIEKKNNDNNDNNNNSM
ncbi:MAG: MobA/MobL family protein [Comamonadaceae bacterium]|nr:MobA/MobL family protein [Comamonadaceae bacterium]